MQRTGIPFPLYSYFPPPAHLSRTAPAHCAILADSMDTEIEGHHHHHEGCDHSHGHSHSHGPHEDQPKTQAEVNIQEMLQSKIAELEIGSSKDEEEERKLGMRESWDE